MPSGLYIGALSGFAVAALSSAYAGVLALGLLTLPSSGHAIQNPWFTAMEVLILAMAPALVGFTIGLHAWADAQRKPHAMLSVVFMSMCAAMTCCVHFVVLVLSRHPAFDGPMWADLVFSFRWPSVVYALDILAWDIFFPLAALFAALAVDGAGLTKWVRWLLFASAAFAFIGLAGVPLANMNVRNVGIIGYALLFPAAAFLLALVFRRCMRRIAG